MKLHKTTKNHLPTPLLHKHTSRQVIALTVTINPSLTKIEPLTSAQFRTNKSSPPIQHTSITILPPFVTHSMYMTLHTGVHKTISGFPVLLDVCMELINMFVHGIDSLLYQQPGRWNTTTMKYFLSTICILDNL